MDINLNVNANVTFNAAPSFVEAMANFANVFGKSAALPAAPAQPEEPKKTRSRGQDKTPTPTAPETADVVAEKETAAAVEATEPTSDPGVTPEPEKEPEPAAATAPTLKLEDVREKLATISRAGKTAQVKELISSFGAGKLTDIPEDKYAELLEKAEKL
jgi:hypothetical protein